MRHKKWGPFYFGGSYCALEIDVPGYALQFWCKDKLFNLLRTLS